MAISNGCIDDATAEGKAAEIPLTFGGLRIEYNYHEESVEDQSIIAIKPWRKPELENGDHGNKFTIRWLRAKGPSLDECYFDSTG